MTIPLCAWSSSGYGTSVAPLSGLRDVEPLGERLARPHDPHGLCDAGMCGELEQLQLYIVDGRQTPRIADRPATIGSENYISVLRDVVECETKAVMCPRDK